MNNWVNHQDQMTISNPEGMKLVIASNNPHKIHEIDKLLGDQFNLLTLDDIGCSEELPETSDTLEGNASQKAWHLYHNYGYNCFADDTGLEIESLNGAPGVISARFAGPARDANANIDKVLCLMREINNRKARFRTVISLILDGNETLFEGIVDGVIAKHPRGSEGFGYDPVFEPEGLGLTFAEMSLEQKNRYSHRARATTLMAEHLLRLTQSR